MTMITFAVDENIIEVDDQTQYLTHLCGTGFHFARSQKATRLSRSHIFSRRKFRLIDAIGMQGIVGDKYAAAYRRMGIVGF